MVLDYRQTRPVAVVETLGALLTSVVDRHSDRPFLVTDGAVSTYAEFFDAACTMAGLLTELGVQPGDRVGTLLPNGARLPATLFGAALADGVFVPINPRSTAPEIVHAVNRAGISVLVTASDVPELLERLVAAFPSLVGRGVELRLAEAPTLRRIVITDGVAPPFAVAFDAPAGRGGAQPVPARVGAHDALLLFTSGTTAAPKACRLRHDALLRNATAAASSQAMGLTPDDRMWNPLPMFHTGGIMPMLAAMSAGASLSTNAQFSAPVAVESIESQRITVAYPAFPAIYGRLVDGLAERPRDVSSIRCVVAVGTSALLESLCQAFPKATLLNMYGATELTGIIAYSAGDDDRASRLKTCGHPFEGVMVRIEDPETGTVLPPGALGEITISGYAVFAGYFGDPEATMRVVRDGWLHTGDRGSLDADGHLVFEGRLKEMLKVGGENVSPLEVEGCLQSHAAVRMALVVGRPDDRWGDIVVAFVEREPDVELSVDELAAYCRERLSSFKVPREFRFVSAWPMSATKIQKARLLDLLR
jgi:acyl-CoA synthetase (AMP-forming)/AMP-acid ligase II